MNPNAIIEVEETGRVTYLNPAARKLLPDMEPKGFAHPWLEGFDRMFLPPAEKSQSVLSQDKELEGRWHHLEGYQVPGFPRRIRVYTFDVTERVRADLERKESEKRFHSLFDNMRNGYAYCRMIFENDEPVDFVYLDVNKAFEKHTGLNNVVGRKVTDVIPGILESQPELFRTCGRVALHGGVESFEIYLDSLGAWLDVTAYSTEKLHISAMVENNTERKRSARALQEQAALLDVIADAVIVRDLAGHALYWNKAAEAMYGWKSEEALGGVVDRLLRTDDAEAAHACRTVIETGHWAGEFSRKSRDGRELVIEARWTLVRNADGSPTSILAVNTDVTERRAIQSQLFRAQRLESLGTLAGGIAHDLNNVLTPISMAVEALSLQHRDERTQKILEIVGTAAGRGASIVRQVLSFARGTEGERTDVQPRHTVKEVLQIIGETFPKSILVASQISRDLSLISADVTQIHQVLMNLCVNARDAMPGGGKLTISAENVTLDETYARMHLEARPIPYVMMKVEDTGTGMAPGVLERIFDPFFTTKAVGKGTGLGLSTARSIVKSHGGFIHVHSEPGKGTSFEVYIPASPQGEAAGAEKIHDGIPMGEGELILVVDDEAPVREIARQILVSYGYSVIVAGDGTEALARYVERRSEVRLVITDMMMPHMDGAATIRALRRLDPSVRIVASSGLVARGQSMEAIDLGVDAILSKPYTADTLLRTISRVLTLPQHSPHSPAGQS